MEIQSLPNQTEKAIKPPPPTPPPRPSPPQPQQQPPLPPSVSSSPSHDFSFTISLRPSSTTAGELTDHAQPPIDFDLAPADEIFLHGHLLPLPLLSRQSISPRPSDISINSAAFPLVGPFELENKLDADEAAGGSAGDDCGGRSKNKYFSSLLALQNWLRRKKKAFDVGRLFRKYASMVEPRMFFKADKEKGDLRRKPNSFSGSAGHRESRFRRQRWRGEFSAPASMRTSPANSGLLVAPSTSGTFSSSDESTMEELHSAIQAAIAHCKNSINAIKDDKCR
ncbi:putative BRI1 kinase inhibitor 1 [Apostasia shenzhenica]|uniref:Putative BRI1 kinase inhibitor 1 n=1 Tax=Apostasia shenzhenica TaxID=1088818 RepID=A0A2I0B5Y2_9ASPA|nr:putative BRI1 kinase inhibitor 1 [Apostasia shenzhenica]